MSAESLSSNSFSDDSLHNSLRRRRRYKYVLHLDKILEERIKAAAKELNVSYAALIRGCIDVQLAQIGK